MRTVGSNELGSITPKKKRALEILLANCRGNTTPTPGNTPGRMDMDGCWRKKIQNTRKEGNGIKFVHWVMGEKEWKSYALRQSEK